MTDFIKLNGFFRRQYDPVFADESMHGIAAARIIHEHYKDDKRFDDLYRELGHPYGSTTKAIDKFICLTNWIRVLIKQDRLCFQVRTFLESLDIVEEIIIDNLSQCKNKTIVIESTPQPGGKREFAEFTMKEYYKGDDSHKFGYSAYGNFRDYVGIHTQYL